MLTTVSQSAHLDHDAGAAHHLLRVPISIDAAELGYRNKTRIRTVRHHLSAVPLVSCSVRWFVGSLVRWFVGSLVRWFVGSLVGRFKFNSVESTILHHTIDPPPVTPSFLIHPALTPGAASYWVHFSCPQPVYIALLSSLTPTVFHLQPSVNVTDASQHFTPSSHSPLRLTASHLCPTHPRVPAHPPTPLPAAK